ncbi:MAG: hypothetical protein IJL34_08235 [Treponema sp.]|nr:hypothetical protein [Treponema sp.]
MKNRISVLFSVILGTMLITSCSSVFQPNKRVADIEVKASLSGTMARDITSSSDDDYSFIDDMLASAEISDDEKFFIYYKIISNLTGPDYGLSEEKAYDILIDKIINTSSDFSNLSGYEDFWMQIKTNFGQKSEIVYPYAKQMDLIKSYYKAAIKPAYNFYSFLDEAGLLSNGQPDYEALAVYPYTHPDAAAECTRLQQEYNASLATSLPADTFALTKVSLKLNSVPFDQEVTFTLLINYDSEEGKGPEKFEFTRFVNPGLNVFDFTPGETTATGDDVKDDDNDVISDDPWENYTKYYVSDLAAEGATGSEDDPMSLSSAFSNCIENYKGKYAIILTEDITLSKTLTVPESAYIVITGNYVDSIKKTIQAGDDLYNHMFSIDNYANLGLSSINLKGNTYCQLFYCSNSASEEDTVTSTKSPTGTLTMENCTVTDFLGTQDVGIISMATGGEMNITGCIFEDNYVTSKGAIYINNGTLNLNIEGLLDSSLSSLSTNSFSDTISDLDTTGDNSPCEIYLKGTGIFNETNEFLNSILYAVHVAGWTELTLNGTYNSGTVDLLKIYSTTDGSISNEKSKNTINVDAEDTVTIDDDGDINKEKPTYTTYILKSTN